MQSKEPEFQHSDGTVRKQHYGSGKQPWDFFIENHIAFEFALGCLIRCVRRDASIKGSERDEDIKKGRWYADRVKEFIQQSTTKTPEGRRKLKLYSDIIYGVLNKAERALLNLED
jgi:hypothetical protein